MNDTVKERNMIDSHKTSMEQIHKKHQQLEQAKKRLEEKEEELKVIGAAFWCVCKENIKSRCMYPCGHSFCEVCVEVAKCIQCGVEGYAFPLQ